MARFLKKRGKKSGLPPGSLVYIGREPYEGVRVTDITYDEQSVNERDVTDIEEAIEDVKDHTRVTWISVEGLADPKVIEALGRQFEIQNLWLEDVLNTDHRPKVEELDDLMFVLIKSVREPEAEKRISFDQISLFLGEDFVVSIQEVPSDVFKPVKERIRSSKGRIRSLKADYLFYALIDSVVDRYYVALEYLGIKIEKLEKSIEEDPKPSIPLTITELKNDLLYLSKSANPIKDTLALICRSNNKDISPDTKKYFTDAYEHSVQIVEVIESYRQMLTSAMDFYQSKMYLRINDSMMLLTVFSSIFIPLTFLTGVYGMNFDNMPELKTEYGYFVLIGAMLSIVAGMLIYFRRKKWI